MSDWKTCPKSYDHKSATITMSKKVLTQKAAPPKRIPVYYNGQRIGLAKALDRIANDRPPAPLCDHKNPNSN